MRPNVLPGLLAAAQRNAARGLKDLGPLRSRPAIHGPEPGEQLTAATGMRMGAGPRTLVEADRGAPMSSKQRPTCSRSSKPAGFAGETAQVTSDAPVLVSPRPLGRAAPRARRTCSPIFGELHPRILQAFDLPGPGRRLRGDARNAARAESEGHAKRARSSTSPNSKPSSATSPSWSKPKSRPPRSSKRGRASTAC